MSENEQTVDYAALRAQQVATVQGQGFEVMQTPHFKAFRSGFPPDFDAIVTPRELYEQVALGQTPEGGTPVAKALDVLDEFIGPYVPVLRPTATFNEGLSNDSLSSLFNPSSPRNV